MGRPELVSAVRMAKQFLTFVNGAPFQPAIAAGLRLGDGYYQQFTAELQAKRDLFAGYLERAGFDVFTTEGTYFLTVDISSVAAARGGPADSVGFCLALPERAGVVAVPSSVFYTDSRDGDRFVRFCFTKNDAMLHDAGQRLVDAFS